MIMIWNSSQEILNITSYKLQSATEVLKHSLAVPILVRKVEHLLRLEGVHRRGQQLAIGTIKFDIASILIQLSHSRIFDNHMLKQVD